jgi:hypothetical protein
MVLAAFPELMSCLLLILLHPTLFPRGPKTAFTALKYKRTGYSNPQQTRLMLFKIIISWKKTWIIKKVS